MNGRRVATEEEIAKVLDGFEEELLLASGLKPKVQKPAGAGAQVVEFLAKLSEQGLLRRQLVIDQAWERVLEQRRRLGELLTCHRGPEDSDWSL